MIRKIWAFALGCYERLRWVDGFGRTWTTRPDLNEAYDRGANLADRLTRPARTR